LVQKDELNLLKQLFQKIIIAQSVKNELLQKNPQHLIQIEKIKNALNDWIVVEDVKEPKIHAPQLGKGELDSINLSLESIDCLLLMDEKKGRIIARSLNIKILGVLGILALARKKNYKSKEEIFKNIENLLQQGFYLSSEVIISFINSL